MNPILNQLMSSAMQNNPIMNLFKTVSAAQNPSAMMQQMANNNSQLQQTLNFINQNGGNAKQLFYSMAQQKGVNPETIINQLKNQT